MALPSAREVIMKAKRKPVTIVLNGAEADALSQIERRLQSVLDEFEKVQLKKIVKKIG